MSDFSVDRRLELIRSVREEQAKNYMTMKRRETVLYGNDYTYAAPKEARSQTLYSGLKIRIIFALLFFLVFLIMDKNHYSFISLNTDKIFEYVTTTPNSIDFMEFLPYTLED